MDVWVSLPQAAPRDLVALASELDHTGVTGVAVSDHMCVPDDVASGYPYAGGRPPQFPADAEFPDPVTLIAVMAGVTSRLRFMTHVLLAPLWHPIALARQVATAAAFADGRFDLGVGVGWMREEYDALEVDFERRGSRLDEEIPLLRRLWQESVVEHPGKHHAFRGVSVRPLPPSPVPVLVGGHSRAAIRRAARLGDGWVGVNPELDELQALLALVQKERAQAGTGDSSFLVRSGVKGALTDERLAALARMGIDGLVVLPWQLSGPRPAGDAPPASPAAVAEAAAEIVRRVESVTAARRHPESGSP